MNVWWHGRHDAILDYMDVQRVRGVRCPAAATGCVVPGGPGGLQAAAPRGVAGLHVALMLDSEVAILPAPPDRPDLITRFLSRWEVLIGAAILIAAAWAVQFWLYVKP